MCVWVCGGGGGGGRGRGAVGGKRVAVSIWTNTVVYPGLSRHVYMYGKSLRNVFQYKLLLEVMKWKS